VPAELVEVGEWTDRVSKMKDDGWWFSGLCGIDRLHAGSRRSNGEEASGKPGPDAGDSRFGVVAQFLHQERKERLTLHVIAEGDPPTVPSITKLWPGANFFERETYDLFGIHFDGHPNLTRIMLPDEWEGHPLRKDYGVGKVPVEFRPQRLLQIETPGQAPGSQEAGQEVDRLGQSVPVPANTGEVPE
jgi:NADH-quinone oxidoreductase subunit C